MISSVYKMNFNTSLAMAIQSCLLIFLNGQSKDSSNPIIHLSLDWENTGISVHFPDLPWLGTATQGTTHLIMLNHGVAPHG